ncbi:hypothetical protein BDQ12DRAFT_692037 [Crucibulum laeve]|uniref:FAD-binding domain-containing protein n=1 Tax=Crucibulum laeve TaxID=68775 RepID=A0A5C3LIQ1_9AGAR|nr:hypothetical protein BDQ12DRAFT_692037 [Crucibulum laeve]
MPSTAPKIAIIGGGPAGLTLARLLQCYEIPSTIFEADSSRTARSQGGTLDIHEDSGQRALREAGLIEQFTKHMRIEGAAMRIVNTSGKITMDEGGEAEMSPHPMETRPEIDRIVLRDILLDSVDASTVHWNHKVARIEPVSGNKFDIHFSDSVAKGFDIVVGADGTWSRVRPLLMNTQPFYSGIMGLEAHLSSVDEREPDLGKRVGNGSCFQLGDKKALMSQRNGDGSIRTYAMLRVTEEWIKSCGIDWNDGQSAKKLLIEKEFSDWDETGKDLIQKSDSDLAVRPLYMLPIGTKWDPLPGVTLIGDAAHVMLPFAGEGVNLAMVDALELANKIKLVIGSNGSTTLKDAMEEFEASMFDRVKKFAEESYNNMEMMFSGETADEITEKIRAMMGPPPE